MVLLTTSTNSHQASTKKMKAISNGTQKHGKGDLADVIRKLQRAYEKAGVGRNPGAHARTTVHTRSTLYPANTRLKPLLEKPSISEAQLQPITGNYESDAYSGNHDINKRADFFMNESAGDDDPLKRQHTGLSSPTSLPSKKALTRHQHAQRVLSPITTADKEFSLNDQDCAYRDLLSIPYESRLTVSRDSHNNSYYNNSESQVYINLHNGTCECGALRPPYSHCVLHGEVSGAASREAGQPEGIISPVATYTPDPRDQRAGNQTAVSADKILHSTTGMISCRDTHYHRQNSASVKSAKHENQLNGVLQSALHTHKRGADRGLDNRAQGSPLVNTPAIDKNFETARTCSSPSRQRERKSRYNRRKVNLFSRMSQEARYAISETRREMGLPEPADVRVDSGSENNGGEIVTTHRNSDDNTVNCTNNTNTRNDADTNRCNDVETVNEDIKNGDERVSKTFSNKDNNSDKNFHREKDNKWNQNIRKYHNFLTRQSRKTMTAATPISYYLYSGTGTPATSRPSTSYSSVVKNKSQTTIQRPLTSKTRLPRISNASVNADEDTRVSETLQEIGRYKLLELQTRKRENPFEITPPGYDSRYNDVINFRRETSEEKFPSEITAQAVAKCNEWLTKYS